MGKVNYSYGKSTNLSNEPIVEGKVRVTPDSQNLYFDLNGERIHITDILYVDSLPSTLIENKIYVKKDGTMWSVVGGSTIQLAATSTGTNMIVSQNEPVDQKNSGDVWLIVEE
jgi:hypothetical protein